MKEKLIDYKDFLREELLDKELAAQYLDAALQENDFVFFKQCLLEVIKARGGITALAKEVGVTRQTIYNLKSHNISFNRLHTILLSLGFKMNLSILS